MQPHPSQPNHTADIDPIATTRSGYNRVAHLYQADREHLRSGPYLRQFMALLPPQSEVLDLGCGSGVPVAQALLKAGHLVTGLDNSATQISLARKHLPNGSFILRDVQTLQAQEFSVQGVVMLYTLFHIPRGQHQDLLSTIATFLPSHGSLLISFGDTDFEGFHDFYGATVWSSQFGPETNRRLLSLAGFKILNQSIDTSGRERHHMVVCEKI